MSAAIPQANSQPWTPVLKTGHQTIGKIQMFVEQIAQAIARIPANTACVLVVAQGHLDVDQLWVEGNEKPNQIECHGFVFTQWNTLKVLRAFDTPPNTDIVDGLIDGDFDFEFIHFNEGGFPEGSMVIAKSWAIITIDEYAALGGIPNRLERQSIVNLNQYFAPQSPPFAPIHTRLFSETETESEKIMYSYTSPSGSPITGIRETVPGIASINGIADNGKVNYDGAGTKMDWSKQRPILDANGDKIFVDDNNCDWPFIALVKGSPLPD